MPSLDNVFFAFIGWLAGVLSPILVDLAREHRQAGQIKQGISAEFLEIQLICAITFYMVRARLGKLDRNDLIWIHSILSKHLDRSDCKTIMQVIDTFLKLSNDQIQIGLLTLKNQPGMGMSIRRLDLPFLQSHLEQIAAFNVYTQRRLLDICRRVRIFNEIGDDAKFYFRMTFESNISPDNYARAVNNYDNYCIQISEQAKEIADQIQVLNENFEL